MGGGHTRWDIRGELTKYAENNVELLRTAGVKVLVTCCADCYYSFKVLYDKIGKRGDLEVWHIGDYLWRLMKEGRLKLSKGLDLKVTYHDPCHLGRKVEPWVMGEGEVKRGELYERPRELLRGIVGVELVEMRRNRENGWCCGAGGGVIDAYPEFARWVALERLKEAKSTGAEVLVTACPWCRRNLLDALKEGDEGLRVYDLVELITQAL